MDEGAVSGKESAGVLIGSADLDAARRAVVGVAVRTPLLASDELAQAAGAPVALKAECLQRGGSFKLRGALAKVAALGARAGAGLVTASAGNHARAVALAARIQGIGCDVFMPVDVSVAKLLAVERLGARVHLDGDSVDEALELAAAFAAAGGPAFVHPFDDIDVIAGQATLGLELLEEVSDLARVVVPVGGGGLASGLGIAFRRAGADVELIGVQASACAPYAELLTGDGSRSRDDPTTRNTIADGIAIKRPGSLTLPLLRELLDGVEAVSEDEIAEAMAFLSEHAKLVSEGAGAASIATLRSGRLAPVAGTTVAIVSGGNVDSGLLAEVLRRHETMEGRRVRMFTRVRDRPGGLAELLNLVAQARANLVNIDHVREAVPLHVRETGVELTLETRGSAHTEEVLAVLAAAGYDVTLE
ncbi:MAG TPA: pyridoxal-phosphate dependent enzyme [Solirubrobacteraceae bacterium]|nr:pyridoxal-phosphate dependent enzyme [Solirubrobacteraceae bacterium]